MAVRSLPVSTPPATIGRARATTIVQCSATPTAPAAACRGIPRISAATARNPALSRRAARATSTVLLSTEEETAMRIHIGATLAIVSALGMATAAAQPAAKNIEAHLAAAKAAAEFDFTGTLARTCIAPQTGPGRDVAPAPAPDRKTWFTEPAKVFDNLYFVGTKIHSSWALTSSEGVILIATLYQ